MVHDHIKKKKQLIGSLQTSTVEMERVLGRTEVTINTCPNPVHVLLTIPFKWRKKHWISNSPPTALWVWFDRYRIWQDYVHGVRMCFELYWSCCSDLEWLAEASWSEWKSQKSLLLADDQNDNSDDDDEELLGEDCDDDDNDDEEHLGLWWWWWPWWWWRAPGRGCQGSRERRRRRGSCLLCPSSTGS